MDNRTLVPRHMFFTKGVGFHRNKLQSFELALREAGNHTAKTREGWGYAVFGKVIEGMDVVDAVSKVETGRRGSMENVPIEPVVIIKVTVRE